MMDIQCIEHVNELSPIAAEWNHFLEMQDNCCSSFLTYEWILNWWKYFGHDHRLAIYLITENSRIIGMAPLMVASQKQFGISLRVIQFIGSGHADHIDFGIGVRGNQRKKTMKMVLDSLFDDSDWDIIDFVDIPNESDNLIILIDELVKRNFEHRLLPAIECPYLQINGDSWNTYYSKCRSKSSRSDLRRRMRRLSDQGRVEFQFYHEPSAIKEIFPQLFEIYNKRWAGKYLSVSFADAAEQKFYREVAMDLAKSGRLHLLTLELNQQVMAFSLSTFLNSHFTWLITAHDPEYGRFFVGEQLLTHLLKEVFESGVYTEFDFTRGAEPYKFKWTSDSRMNCRLLAARPSMVPALSLMMKSSRHTLRSKAKESEWLRRIKLNGIGKLQQITRNLVNIQ